MRIEHAVNGNKDYFNMQQMITAVLVYCPPNIISRNCWFVFSWTTQQNTPLQSCAWLTPSSFLFVRLYLQSYPCKVIISPSFWENVYNTIILSISRLDPLMFHFCTTFRQIYHTPNIITTTQLLMLHHLKTSHINLIFQNEYSSLNAG